MAHTPSPDITVTIEEWLNKSFVGQVVLWGMAHLREPEFITSFTLWAVKLAARILEPLLLVCAVYLMISMGVPSLMQPGMHDFSMSTLTGAPDVILPGGFATVRDRFIKKSYISGILMVLFLTAMAVLTGYANADVFHVIKLEQDQITQLLFWRSMIALAYSTTVIITLLTGMARHEQTVHLPNVQTQIQDLLSRVTEQYQTTASATEQKLTDLASGHGIQFRSLTEYQQTIQGQMTEYFQNLSEQNERKLTEYQRQIMSQTEQIANNLTEHFDRTTNEIFSVNADVREQSGSQISALNEQLTALIQGLNQVREQSQKQGETLGALAGITGMIERLQKDLTEHQRTITPVIDGLNQERALTLPESWASLPQLISQIQQDLTEYQRTMTEQLSEHRNTIRSQTLHRTPNIRDFARKERTFVTENTETNTLDKGSFVRQCLTENPNIRNSEIQRKASEHNLTISPAYISEVRKAFESSTEQVS